MLKYIKKNDNYCNLYYIVDLIYFDNILYRIQREKKTKRLISLTGIFFLYNDIKMTKSLLGSWIIIMTSATLYVYILPPLSVTVWLTLYGLNVCYHNSGTLRPIYGNDHTISCIFWNTLSGLFIEPGVTICNVLNYFIVNLIKLIYLNKESEKIYIPWLIKTQFSEMILEVLLSLIHNRISILFKKDPKFKEYLKWSPGGPSEDLETIDEMIVFYNSLLF